MASQTRSPSGTTNNNASPFNDGSGVWSSTASVVSSNDLRAASLISSGSITIAVQAYDYGFTIPAGSSIDGIVVSVERRAVGGTGGTAKDRHLKLTYDGGTTFTGDDKADTATAWGGSDSIASYGSASDKWSTSPTYSDINSSDFGAALSVEETSGSLSVSAQVDHIEITVYYTPATGADISESSPPRTDSITTIRNETATVAETSSVRRDQVTIYAIQGHSGLITESSPARTDSVSATVTRIATIADTSPLRTDSSTVETAPSNPAEVAESSPLRTDAAVAIRNETIVGTEESPPRTDAATARRNLTAAIAADSPVRTDSIAAWRVETSTVAESSPARTEAISAWRVESASIAESSPSRIDAVATIRNETATVAETSPTRTDAIAGGINTYAVVDEYSPARTDACVASVVRQATINESSPPRTDSGTAAGEIWHQALRRYRPISETRPARSTMRHTGV